MLCSCLVLTHSLFPSCSNCLATCRSFSNCPLIYDMRFKAIPHTNTHTQSSRIPFSGIAAVCLSGSSVPADGWRLRLRPQGMGDVLTNERVKGPRAQEP